jgi:hypothetical protein
MTMFDWWDIFPACDTRSHAYTIYEFKNELTFTPSFSLGLDLACIPNGKSKMKIKMLQSQSNIFITMAREMVVDNAYQKVLIKTNTEVNI